MVLASIFQRGARADEARLAHALRGVPLFRDLPAQDLVEVWRQLKLVEADEGAVLAQRGDPGDRLWIVQSGSVEIRLGLGQDGVVIRRSMAGDFAGEMALLTGEPRSADMVAAEPTRLWALDREDFDRLVSRSIPLLRALNHTLCERLSLTTALLRERQAADRSSAGGGMRFGPYRVVEQIGVGGMAAVYSASHVDTGEAVALKVLPAGWGNAPELRARLQREAAALTSIEHPNVVRVYEVGEVESQLGGGCYIALEWLPHALDRVLRAQYPEPLSADRALRLAHGVAAALAAVHEKGLLHRDVKPSNVLLRADGAPVLTDFGLVTALAEAASSLHLTPTNVVVGTADYMAPEQIGGGAPDPRTDLYALGATLYEMLAGHVPFAGREPMETLRAHETEPPPPLPDDVPPAARRVVERAMRKLPDERYRSATEMGQAIDEALAAL